MWHTYSIEYKSEIKRNKLLITQLGCTSQGHYAEGKGAISKVTFHLYKMLGIITLLEVENKLLVDKGQGGEGTTPSKKPYK